MIMILVLLCKILSKLASKTMQDIAGKKMQYLCVRSDKSLHDLSEV